MLLGLLDAQLRSLSAKKVDLGVSYYLKLLQTIPLINSNWGEWRHMHVTKHKTTTKKYLHTTYNDCEHCIGLSKFTNKLEFVTDSYFEEC